LPKRSGKKQTEFVKVGYARNQVDAEFMQGLLKAEGIPSFLKRSPAFDVPDFLVSGPRDIYVNFEDEQIAQSVLQDVQAERAVDQEGLNEAPAKHSYGKVAAVTVVLLLLFTLTLWTASQL